MPLWAADRKPQKVLPSGTSFGLRIQRVGSCLFETTSAASPESEGKGPASSSPPQTPAQATPDKRDQAFADSLTGPVPVKGSLEILGIGFCAFQNSGYSWSLGSKGGR